MKAAVTGASGHLAANLLPLLVDAGFDVRAVTMEPLDVAPPGLQGLDIERVRAEITDPEQVRDALSGCEIVYHLAARISMDPRDAEGVWTTNVEGTRNVVDACKRSGVERLIHVSSIAALPSSRRAVGEHLPSADDPALPMYARSKIAAESIVREAAGTGLHAVMVNPTALVGPKDHGPSSFGRIFLDLWGGKLPAAPRGGTNVVDIRDVAQTMVNASERGESGERYLVGGSWISLMELAELSSELFGTPVPRFTVSLATARRFARVGETFNRILKRRGNVTADSVTQLSMHRLVLSTRAMDELGHVPRPIERTLADTYAWFIDHGYLEVPKRRRAPQPA